MADETKEPKKVQWENGDKVMLWLQLAASAVVIFVGILIGYFLFREVGPVTGDNGYIANVYTNVLSVLVTVFVIDRLNRRRDEQRQEYLLKEQLIRDAGSQLNEVAKHAIYQLNHRDWLRGEQGVLQGADLFLTDLRGVNFLGADLCNVTLDGAHFDDKTCLPDGTFWAPETDLERFTNPTHRHFWRSEDFLSPALAAGSRPLTTP